jgi:tripartite-type tricarboxylate transporter receptor subunit TctC
MARKKEGGITYASQGKGAIGHLLGSMFAKATGAPMVHVPYRGTAQATLDLITGRVDMVFNNYSSFKSEYEAGRLKALGVISKERMPVFAGVPTMTEAGYPSVDFESWFGLVAPAGVPKEVVQKLNDIFTRAANHPDTVQWINKLGLTIRTNSPEEFEAFVKEKYFSMKKFVAETGMTLD